MIQVGHQQDEPALSGRSQHDAQAATRTAWRWVRDRLDRDGWHSVWLPPQPTSGPVDQLLAITSRSRVGFHVALDTLLDGPLGDRTAPDHLATALLCRALLNGPSSRRAGAGEHLDAAIAAVQQARRRCGTRTQLHRELTRALSLLGTLRAAANRRDPHPDRPRASEGGW